MILITLALLAIVFSFSHPLLPRLVPFSASALVPLLGVGLTLQLILLFHNWPQGVDQVFVDHRSHAQCLALLTVATILIGFGLNDYGWMRKWWFPALLIVHLLLGFWMVHASPNPHIDVWVFQQRGPEALLQGKNPYDAKQLEYPDIYHSTRPGAQEVYGPGMSANDRLQFGFPYPPLSLLLATIGYAIAHDHRYAQAAAVTLAGLFIGYARPGRVAMLCAGLLLFTPRVLFILGRGWTEPFVVMLLAATIFCRARKLWALLPVALGLFLASKQYLALAVPFTFLLLPEPFDWRVRNHWRQWMLLLLKTGIVACIVTLPLALWNWHAFWFSTVTVQQKAPFRWDALSYLVFLGFRDSKYITWTWLVIVALLPAIALGLWRAPRSVTGFAAALALVFLVFFAFNKQAFCNYYFFTIGALVCAAALEACPNVPPP